MARSPSLTLPVSVLPIFGHALGMAPGTAPLELLRLSLQGARRSDG